MQKEVYVWDNLQMRKGWMAMRIVIVGLGQTGQELAKEFIDAGHDIIVIDTD